MVEAVLVNSLWAVLPGEQGPSQCFANSTRPQGLELDVVLNLELLLLRPQRAQCRKPWILTVSGMLMVFWGFAFRSRARLPDPGRDRRPLPWFLNVSEGISNWTSETSRRLKPGTPLLGIPTVEASVG